MAGIKFAQPHDAPHLKHFAELLLVGIANPILSPSMRGVSPVGRGAQQVSTPNFLLKKVAEVVKGFGTYATMFATFAVIDEIGTVLPNFNLWWWVFYYWWWWWWNLRSGTTIAFTATFWWWALNFSEVGLTLVRDPGCSRR